MVQAILASVSFCLSLSFSALVNLIEPNVFPSFFHDFLHVVAVPSHSRMRSGVDVWFRLIVAHSKAMLAMFRFRYLSFRLSAFLALRESGLSSILPCSFLCADSSCLSLLISKLLSCCACFFLEFVVVWGGGVAYHFDCVFYVF